MIIIKTMIGSSISMKLAYQTQNKQYNDQLSNGLFFFERCSLITATVYANKFFNLYAQTVAVIRVHLSKKNNPLLKYVPYQGF